MSIVKRTEDLIKLAIEEFEAMAVEKEDYGRYPGALSITVPCAGSSSVELICTQSENTLYSCDITFFGSHGQELCSRVDGKVSKNWDAMMEKINVWLSTATEKPYVFFQ